MREVFSVSAVRSAEAELMEYERHPDELMQLAARGVAILMISSELPELIGLCDRIYAISEGRLTGEVAREEATQERLMHFMTMDPSKDKATR